MPQEYWWSDEFTFAVAAIGAILGVLNWYQNYAANQVKLRVRPSHAFGVPDGRQMFCIEVVNLSKFDVTVHEVGFTLDGNSISSLRAAVPIPMVIDGGKWPRRLEAREAVSVYLDPTSFSQNRNLGMAYARTSCGEVGYGTSPALKQLKSMLN